MHDLYNLARFLEAQNPIYPQVVSELRAASKRSHWMWFIFPQIKGLGYSPTSIRFAISSLDEAKAYIDHAVLGPRLIECTTLVNQSSGRSIHQIFGSPDDMKFHSSMTLFAHAAPDKNVFQDALQKFFAGKDDPFTVDRL
jgi:uncharacterized protein (DUF1810 family)